MKLPPKAVIAQYTQQTEIAYQGNPFIEALPPKPSQQALRDFLSCDISDTYDEHDDDVIRFHKIASIIDGFFQPLKNHFQLEQKLSLMIRKGYIGRNVQDAQLTRLLQQGYDDIKSGGGIRQFASVLSTAQSTMFVGGSGLGKTSVLNRLLSSYPQVIYHPSYNQIQITYLKIDCPHDGNLKGLCMHFLTEIDNALGTSYMSGVNRRWTIENLMSHFGQIATRYAVGVLIIDEMQALLVANSSGKDKMLQFFGRLVNVLSLPILFVGTPKAKRIMMDSFMYARRSTGMGALEWAPLTRVAKKRARIGGAEAKTEWNGFIERLWKNQFLRHTQDLTDEIRDAWFDCSQGITDIVVKLFVFSQIRAIATGQERISVRLIYKVFEDEFKPIHPMIEALRSGDPDRIAQYSDLYLDNSLSRLAEQESIIRQSAAKASAKTKQEFGGNQQALSLYHYLLELSVPQKEAETLVKMVMNENPGATLADCMRVALVYYAEKRHLKSPKAKRTDVISREDWQTLESDDLRYIFADKSGSMYEALRQKQPIPPLGEIAKLVG